MSEERIDRIENVLREFIQSRVEKADRIISHLTDSDCITDIRTANEVDKALLEKLRTPCEKAPLTETDAWKHYKRLKEANRMLVEDVKMLRNKIYKEVADKLKLNKEDLKFIRYDICQGCDEYEGDDTKDEYWSDEILCWCRLSEHNELGCPINKILKVIKELRSI